MADPATIMIGMQVAGQVIGAKSESDSLRSAARAQDENARRAELDGAIEETAMRRRERAVSGGAIAAMGAGGTMVGTGSALDLLRQNAIEREYDVLTARYDAAGKADEFRADASAKRGQAKGALFGGLLRAGASAMSGMSSMNSAKSVSAASDPNRLPGGSRMPIPSRWGY